MDKRLVDPRRPRHEKLTEAEREERLLPYSPLLYQASNMFVTYNRNVPRLAGEGAPRTLDCKPLLFTLLMLLQNKYMHTILLLTTYLLAL